MARKTYRRKKSGYKRTTKRPAYECVVYAIVSQDGDIKYIGQTRGSASKRFAQHASEPQGRIGEWLKAEYEAGRKPMVRTLTTCGIWDVSEIIWIERCRAAGIEILNKALGGKDKARTATISKSEAHYRRTGEIVLF